MDSGNYITTFSICNVKSEPLLHEGIEDVTALSKLFAAATRDRLATLTS